MNPATESPDALALSPSKAPLKRKRWVTLAWRALMFAFFVAVATLMGRSGRPVGSVRRGMGTR